MTLDDVEEVEELPMTRFQARYVEYLITGGKHGKRHTLRAMTRKFTTRYSNYTELIGIESDAEEMNRDGWGPVAEGSTGNQLLGMELVYRAGQILGKLIDY